MNLSCVGFCGSTVPQIKKNMQMIDMPDPCRWAEETVDHEVDYDRSHGS